VVYEKISEIKIALENLSKLIVQKGYNENNNTLDDIKIEIVELKKSYSDIVRVGSNETSQANSSSVTSPRNVQLEVSEATE